MTSHPRTVAQQAGILCNDAAFQRFAAHRSGFPGGQFSPEASAEFLRQQCGIGSRRHLDTNPTARDRFQQLRTNFDAWAGRIPAQR